MTDVAAPPSGGDAAAAGSQNANTQSKSASEHLNIKVVGSVRVPLLPLFS